MTTGAPGIPGEILGRSWEQIRDETTKIKQEHENTGQKDGDLMRSTGQAG